MVDEVEFGAFNKWLSSNHSHVCKLRVGQALEVK